MFRTLPVLLFAMIACPAMAQESPSPAELSGQIRESLQALEFDRAAGLAEQLAATAAEDRSGDQYRLRAADALLRSGRPEKAVPLFDEFAKKYPDQKPYLWQRGIALYFVGRFADGAEQFEVHRQVNSNDVENAAWHYLCVAKNDSPETADSLLLPAPGDPREPMEQVLEMFRHRQPRRVTERLAELKQAGSLTESAQFYGQLYLGLYADAVSDRATAAKHMKRAVDHAPRNYMGDVARVYFTFLSKQKTPK